MKNIIFKGCGTAIATPFKGDTVNIPEFKRLLEYQIANKCDSIIVCGTTGESATLTTEEKKELIKCSVETCNKKIPVIVGTGSNNTLKAIEQSKLAEKLGADGLLVVTPYYNKCTQEGLIQYYSTIASSVNLPIILYNVPSRTGVNIEPQTCYELSKITNIVAIKEASGNISQIAKIANLCKDNLNIYSGNDDQILPILSLGGIGAISVLSNIYPTVVHNICYNYFNKNIDIAKELQLNSIPLINALFEEVNPIPIKSVLNLLGFDFGIPRPPLTRSKPCFKEKIKVIVANINPFVL